MKHMESNIAANPYLHHCLLVLQVHDELGARDHLSRAVIYILVYEVPMALAGEFARLLKRTMEAAVSLRVATTVTMCVLVSAVLFCGQCSFS